MSDFSCPVVEIKLNDHPNADNLSLIYVGGYQIVVRTEDWQDKKLGVFIPPDSVVPNTREFEFLKGSQRIKTRKFRGIYSQGLLMPAPDDAAIGEDFSSRYGITHYQPPEKFTCGENVAGPLGVFLPKYDVENIKNDKFNHLIKDRDEVYASEKFHGCGARYLWWNNSFWIGSRTMWKTADGNTPWHIALKNHPEIEGWCKQHPGLTLYGECFGQVQSLRYGLTTVKFAAFDIWDGKQWMEYDEAKMISTDIPWVIELYRGPFDLEMMTNLAEGDSSYSGANNMREGIVIRPIPNKISPELGRVQLKLVSNRYLVGE